MTPQQYVAAVHSLGLTVATVAPLLDVHLRGERSDPLIGECHARRPPIPVVLVTGSADISQERLGDADAVLPKPFELEELLTTVREFAEASLSPTKRPG